MSFQQSEGVNPYSEKTAMELDREIRNIVDQCYAEVH